MKKILIKFLIWFSLLLSIWVVHWWAINLSNDWTDKIKKVSIDNTPSWFESWVENIWKSLLRTFKVVIWWLLVIYLVYAWVLMIISMWDDEKKLSSAKNAIWYSLVWLLFVNIPWTLYNAFSWKETADSVTWSFWNEKTIYDRNIFINTDVFWSVLWTILSFLQIIVVALAVFVFVLQWIKIMKARWEQEDVQEAKNKIIYALGALVFIWIMVIWKNIAFFWDISAWRNLFTTLANLALYFAWPTAIFFLSLAWYYYITWKEDNVKKAKTIVVNTMLATLILLWMYTFLLELWTFKI